MPSHSATPVRGHPAVMANLRPDDVDVVRESFLASGYVVDGDRSEVDVLARLFIDGEALRLEELRAEDASLEAMQRLELVQVEGESVRALVKVEPYRVRDGIDAWLVSDFLRAPLAHDHVLGGGGAAATLAAITIPDEVESFLDVGTGGGIQLLHAATHASSMTGTDINERALGLASLTTALSGIDAELLKGDRFVPVADRRFDLIVSNPPMVIGPSTDLEYRDSGLALDGMSRSIVERAPWHLTERGTCQLLAHWVHLEGQDWRERVASWVDHPEVDVWVIQREVLDPPTYVDAWLSDSGVDGLHDDGRRERWLAWFEEHHVHAIGMGWIALRRTGRATTFRLEHQPQTVDQPVGAAISRGLRAHALAEQLDDHDLAAMVWRPADDVILEVLEPRADAEPEYGLLQTGGLRRAVRLDVVGAAILAGCDGVRTLAHVLETTESEGDGFAVGTGAIDAFRGLLARGFVEPVGPPV
jgi:hypothetical protein